MSMPVWRGYEEQQKQPLSFDPTRAALFIIDFQNYSCHPEGYHARVTGRQRLEKKLPAIQNAARALAAARSKDMQVIHVGLAVRKGAPDANRSIPVLAAGPERSIEGTFDSEFFDLVKPIDGEIIIIKRGISAFAGTELDRLLRIKEINTIVLTGSPTNFAVEGTVREGVDRGFRGIVLEDCCTDVFEEWHEYSVRVNLPQLGTVSTADEFIQFLGD